MVPIARRRHPNDVHVRLSDRLYRSLGDYGDSAGLPITGVIRLLCERALAADTGLVPDERGELERQLASLATGSLATLVAIEQLQLFLGELFPQRKHPDDHLDEAGTRARKHLLWMDQAVRGELDG